MPRAQMSTSGKMVEFFRTVSIDVAEFALGQIQDVLRDRRAKSKAAKERAQKGSKPAAAATTAAAPRVAKSRSKTKKKSHHKTKAHTASVASSPALPLQDTYEAGAGEAEDASSLVGAGTQS